jgi:hypothetical protein
MIKYDDYKVKSFLDTNIILECLPLSDLPWSELDSVGPIIALITPTVMQEIDSKKQDGRIGKRAREFNKIISECAIYGRPVLIRNEGPRVELALSSATPIPWDNLDDLDRGDADSRIIAEMIYAKGMNSDGKMIVSHDIKPISLALNNNLDRFHVSDKWLRPRESSPQEKELQRLKAKVALFEETQPAFSISISLPDESAKRLIQVYDLTEEEKNKIYQKIISANPMLNQRKNSFGLSDLHIFDHTYESRYHDYVDKIPDFLHNYSRHIERVFNQTCLKIKIRNVGNLQAENLKAEVSVSNGRIHDRFVFISPEGPKRPHPRSSLISPVLDNLAKIRSRLPVGRHEVSFIEEPSFGSKFSVLCEDFRHEEEWEFTGVVGFEPRAGEAKISVAITAGNFRGIERTELAVNLERDEVHYSEVIESETLRFKRGLPIKPLKDGQSAVDFVDSEILSLDEDFIRRP